MDFKNFSVKKLKHFAEFHFSKMQYSYFFNKSRISPNKVSSLVGSGATVGAAASFFLLAFILLIIMNSTNGYNGQN